MRIRTVTPAFILVVLMAPLFAQPEKGLVSVKGDSTKGDFFIVSSIDLAKKQILLKRPTEVTELMRVDGSTSYLEETGKALRLTDLRAGDTVYIVSKANGDQPVAVTIQKGPMTLDVLHERYLRSIKQP